MNQNNYDDIINLPHHVSLSRPHMPIIDRAAQFAPFAALTGYDAEIKETARLTDSKIELEDTIKDELNERLIYLRDHMGEDLIINITYFLQDKIKSGGKYITDTSSINKIDLYENIITISNGTVIPINDILAIEGDIFNSEEWN